VSELNAATREAVRVRVHSDADTDADADGELGELCARIYLCSIHMLSRLRKIVDAEARAPLRRCALSALRNILTWLVRNVNDVEAVYVTKRYILELRSDYDAGVMSDVEVTSWCTIMDAIVHVLVERGTAIGCTVLMDTCEHAGHPIAGIDGEHARRVEFIEVFQDELVKIIGFMLENRITANDNLCIVENLSYAHYLRGVRSLKRPDTYKETVRDRNGTTDTYITRRVRYDTVRDVLYVSVDGRCIPLIPEAFAVPVTQHLMTNTDTSGTHTPSEIADAEAMRARILNK
jgi:hypothetical protein